MLFVKCGNMTGVKTVQRTPLINTWNKSFAITWFSSEPSVTFTSLAFHSSWSCETTFFLFYSIFKFHNKFFVFAVSSVA